MPIYEYVCPKCQNEFEEIVKLSEKGAKKCPECGAKANRKLSLSSFQLKGDGWYITDYARKDQEKKKAKDKKEEKPESKPADAPTKTSTKPAEAKT